MSDIKLEQMFRYVCPHNVYMCGENIIFPSDLGMVVSYQSNGLFKTDNLCSFEIRPPSGAPSTALIYFEPVTLTNTVVNLVAANSLTSLVDTVTCDVEQNEIIAAPATSKIYVTF